MSYYLCIIHSSFSASSVTGILNPQILHLATVTFEKDRRPHTHRHIYLRPSSSWRAPLSHPGRGRFPGVCYPSPGTQSSPGGCGEWYWRDGHEFEQAPGGGDGQGGLACCSPWGLKESDTTERLNWTELILRKNPEVVRVALQWVLTAAWCHCWNLVLCSLLHTWSLPDFFKKYFYIFIYLFGCTRS